MDRASNQDMKLDLDGAAENMVRAQHGRPLERSSWAPALAETMHAKIGIDTQAGFEVMARHSPDCVPSLPEQLVSDIMLPPQNPPSKEDWERFRPIVKSLYIYENNTLEEVKELMAAEYAFHATVKSFSARRTKWKLFKKLKKSDVQRIRAAIDDRARSGRQTVIERHGRLLDPQTFLRSEYRKRASKTRYASASGRSSNAIFTSDIKCRTPKLTTQRLADPDHYARFEMLLIDMKCYVSMSLALGRPDISEDVIAWRSPDVQRDTAYICMRDIEEGLAYAEEGNSNAALALYRRAFIRLEGLLAISNPLEWLLFLNKSRQLCFSSNPSLSMVVLKHMHAMLNTPKCRLDPAFKVIVHRLMDLEPTEFDPFSSILCNLLLDLWDELLDYNTPLAMNLFHETIDAQLLRDPYVITTRYPITKKIIQILTSAEPETPAPFDYAVHFRSNRAHALSRLGMPQQGLEQMTLLFKSEFFTDGVETDRKPEEIWRRMNILSNLAMIQINLETWSEAKMSFLQLHELLPGLGPQPSDKYERYLCQNLHWLCNHSPIADGDQRWKRLLDLQVTVVETQFSDTDD